MTVLNLNNSTIHTNAIVFHAPGLTTARKSGDPSLHQVWNPLWEPIKMSWDEMDPPIVCQDEMRDITIITWNSELEKGILEQCLDRMNVPYSVLGKRISSWKNVYKIKLLNDLLPNIQTKYIMGFDSCDILLVESPKEIVRRFEKFNCDLLFNAELNFFPPCHYFAISRASSPVIKRVIQIFQFILGEWNIWRIENLLKRYVLRYTESRNFISSEWEEFAAGLSGSPWKFLNGGAWVGKTDYCKEFFGKAVKKDVNGLIMNGLLPHKKKWLAGDIMESEQIILHWLFRESYPRVQLDYNNDIFMNLLHVEKI